MPSILSSAPSSKKLLAEPQSIIIPSDPEEDIFDFYASIDEEFSGPETQDSLPLVDHHHPVPDDDRSIGFLVYLFAV